MALFKSKVTVLESKTKKGKKLYGVANEKCDDIICTSIDIETAKRSLDMRWPILVEMTVTRVFTRERDLKEIEIDELK